MDDLQKIFSSKLDSFAATSLERHAQVVTKATSDPENSEYLILRTLEDFSADMDTKLKRRLVDAPKFREAVMEIRKAIYDGSFVINIVAPEYPKNKDLVDLVVATALTDPPSYTENASPQERERDKDTRHTKMNGNIVRDIDVPEFLRSYGNDADDVASSLATSSFFGEDFFDPNDTTNCMYAFIQDYERDPNIDQEALRAQEAAAAGAMQVGGGADEIPESQRATG